VVLFDTTNHLHKIWFSYPQQALCHKFIAFKFYIYDISIIISNLSKQKTSLFAASNITFNFVGSLKFTAPYVFFAAEKNIVKEFAHLKWGLFDEGVSVTDIKTPVYYSVNGASQPTRLDTL